MQLQQPECVCEVDSLPVYCWVVLLYTGRYLTTVADLCTVWTDSIHSHQAGDRLLHQVSPLILPLITVLIGYHDSVTI